MSARSPAPRAEQTGAAPSPEHRGEIPGPVPGGLGPTEDELAAAVSTLHLWRGANRGVTIVAIDGYGASGKSTIADLLCPRTGASLVRTDDFFLPAARHPDAGGTAAESGRLITSFYDLRRLRAEALEPLRAGREA